MFYKLRKDNPQNIDYAVDYQSEADEEYFSMFKEAGWSKVLSLSDEIHFFSAAEGTKPIYTDRESKFERDEKEKRKFGKYSIYTFILFVLLFPLPILSTRFELSLLHRLSTAVFLIFGMIPFVFSFMPYLGYVHRVRKMSMNK
jgi:hypothetical protein